MKNILLTHMCDIYGFVIEKKDFEEIRKYTKKYENVACYASEANNANFSLKNANLETEKYFFLTLEAKYRVEIGDEIRWNGEKFLVENISRQKFASAVRNFLRLKIQKK